MNRLDYQADRLIRYFRKRAKRGATEARRDWLYGPALIPAGSWRMDDQLDEVIRRAKDIGAEMEPRFELVYVYERPPVWTCDPSDRVRYKNQREEIKREQSAQERLAHCLPPGTPGWAVAHATAGSLATQRKTLNILIAPLEAQPDPVLDRIDNDHGMADRIAVPGL